MPCPESTRAASDRRGREAGPGADPAGERQGSREESDVAAEPEHKPAGRTFLPATNLKRIAQSPNLLGGDAKTGLLWQARSTSHSSLAGSRSKQRFSMNYRILAGSGLLDLPDLMERLGDGDHARARAFCPFCKAPCRSFSVTKKGEAPHCWRCSACTRQGDSIQYLMARNSLSEPEARAAYSEISAAAGGLWVAREHREGYRAGSPPSQVAES